MTIKVGESLPSAKFMLVTPDGPKPVETKDYFGGKTVVLFGLPGAFTPTCHKNHLPGFIVNEARFKGKGVDKIAMTAVNDHYVLAAWSDATGAKGHVDFLADGNGNFAKAVGLDLDLSARRSRAALQALFDAGRRRSGEGAQRRAGGRQGRRLGRGAYFWGRSSRAGRDRRPSGGTGPVSRYTGPEPYRMFPVCPSE